MLIKHVGGHLATPPSRLPAVFDLGIPHED